MPPWGSITTAGSLTAAQHTQGFAYDTLGRLTAGPLGAYTYGAAVALACGDRHRHDVDAAYDAAGDLTCCPFCYSTMEQTGMCRCAVAPRCASAGDTGDR
jgi:hypothetical protein